MLAELQQALVIAVNTPNINTTGAWGTYRTSVDAIEAATGYDLLSNLSLQFRLVSKQMLTTDQQNNFIKIRY
jgi:endonuclease G